jgi:hypothetical protein
VSLTDALSSIWNTILDVLQVFVLPDWGQLIGLLPYLILVGLIGPFLTFTALGTVIYLLTKPRVKVDFVEGPRIAEIGEDGQPIFSPGLPHCRTHRLIYPSGTTRCEQGDEDLAVVCPMCGLGREARIDTCSNCGLVLQVRTRAVPVRATTGPRPGGAAAA